MKKKESYDEMLERLATPKYERLENAGKIVECLRCAAQCRVADRANDHARPIRHADGAGYCPNCAVTEYLRSPEIDISYLLPEGTDIREALRAPHIQEAFAALLKGGMSDLEANSINWNLVIDHWELPFPKIRRKRKSAPAAAADDEWAEFID